MSRPAPQCSNCRRPAPRTAKQCSDCRPFELSPREQDVVRAVTEAMTNREIARHLGITEMTVKHHLTNCFNKFGVSNRLELAVFAIHRGLN